MTRGVLFIFTGECTANTIIMIKNCTFSHNKYLHVSADQYAMINGELPEVNVTLTFINCQFFDNDGLILLSVDAHFC